MVSSEGACAARYQYRQQGVRSLGQYTTRPQQRRESELSQQLINSLFMEAFANPWLAEQEDQARLELQRS